MPGLIDLFFNSPSSYHLVFLPFRYTIRVIHSVIPVISVFVETKVTKLHGGGGQCLQAKGARTRSSDATGPSPSMRNPCS
eukprot:1675353-Amphidinium_carterae.2